MKNFKPETTDVPCETTLERWVWRFLLLLALIGASAVVWLAFRIALEKTP